MERLTTVTEYRVVSQDPYQIQLTSGTNPTSLRLIELAQASPYYLDHTYDRTEPEQVTITISCDLDTWCQTLISS